MSVGGCVLSQGTNNICCVPADNFTGKQSEIKTGAYESDSTVAYLAPLMALLVIVMVTRVLTIEFDWLYPLRVLGTAAVILFFWRKTISRLRSVNTWSVSAIGIGVAVFIIWVGIEWIMGTTETDRAIPDLLQEMPTWFATAWLIFRVIGSVITVPIAEELAFRGYALRRLISPDFDKVSLRFTWFSFIVIHIVRCSAWAVGGWNCCGYVLCLGVVPAG